MTHPLTATLQFRSSVFLGFLLLIVGSTPASAQSVESVVEDMQAQYGKQIETVDTYVVETNLYTSYNRKVMQNGEPSYKTQIRMKGKDATSFASTTTPSAAYGLQFDQLKKHATYADTETIDGVRTHVLQVDDPSKVTPNMGTEAESMTYYVEAERHVPIRMVMQTKQAKQRGPSASSVTINLKNYNTTDGLTLPHRMEIQLATNMSEQQRQKMKQMMQQMENMPEQQRKRMEQMMGNQMDMMKRMLSGEPIAVKVQSVKVNAEIPDDMF